MEKKENSLSPLDRFFRLLKPDSKEIWNVYVYSIFIGLINLSLPLGIQAIINLIQGGQVSTSWIVLLVFVVGSVAIAGLLQIFQMRITENLQQKIFTRASFEFAYRIPRIRLEELYKHYAPELMNRFFDTMSVQKGLPKILIDFSSASLQVVFGLILLSFYHPFFIVFSLILILLIYAIFWITAKRGLDTSLQESAYKYKMAHWLEEMARTSVTFKLAGSTKLPLNKTDGHVGNYLKARESHFSVLVQQFSLMVIFKSVVALGLLALGGILVMEQLMNIGQFVAAEIIILLIINSVEKLITSFETIYDTLTALEKMGQVTDMELEQVSGINLVDQCDQLGLTVDLEDVTFSYPGQIKPTLKNISLHLSCSDKVMITGTNGSGKSTLVQILAGLYNVQSGGISYNGFPIGNLNLESLRSVIGDYISQEQLFEASILDNIAIGREVANFENVKWAVKNLGLEEFIRNLPKGYDTIVDPEGKKFPKSIMEKILIARSIVDKPKLLLIEDAFEHLDEVDRRKIIDFLFAKENEWTMVTISADPYVAKKSNIIFEMSDGQIIHRGTYKEMQSLAKLKKNDNA